MRCRHCNNQEVPADPRITDGYDLAVNHLRVHHPDIYAPLEQFETEPPLMPEVTR